MKQKSHQTTAPCPRRSPDCVTVTHVGDTILTVNGYCDPDARETAEDKLVKILKAAAIRHSNG